MKFTFILSMFFLSFINTGWAQENNDSAYISFYDKTVNQLLPCCRIPVDNDFRHAWKLKDSYVYKTTDDEGKYKAPYWTKGYFNQDDIIDFAYVLINKENQKKLLYAIISEEDGYKAILLEGAHDEEMGLATQESGVFLTASGKGYWEPTKEDPSKINIKGHAISYFAFESAASVFVWNESTHSFKRHWMSD